MDAATLFYMAVQHDLLYWKRGAELAHTVQRPGCGLGESATVSIFGGDKKYFLPPNN
jgi:hypothetical protein